MGSKSACVANSSASSRCGMVCFRVGWGKGISSKRRSGASPESGRECYPAVRSQALGAGIDGDPHNGHRERIRNTLITGDWLFVSREQEPVTRNQ